MSVLGNLSLGHVDGLMTKEPSRIRIRNNKFQSLIGLVQQVEERLPASSTCATVP